MSDQGGTRDREWIKSIIPHRDPMLLVDSVLDIEPGRRIVAIKNVTADEEIFQGHFPGHPVMPGVYLVEGMAQAGGILLLHDDPNREHKLIYFMSLDRARFRRPVTPGDQVRYEVEIVRRRPNHCKLSGRALVNEQVVAEAICTSAMIDR